MRVVVFVVYAGESVASVGGAGTLTATPPVGAPNGYRFLLDALGTAFGAGVTGSAFVLMVVLVVLLVVEAALPAAPALPFASASQTAAPATRAAQTASKLRGRT